MNGGTHAVIERHREDVLHAWSLARTLHDRVGPDARLAASADVRSRFAADPALAGLDETLKRLLFRVAEAAPKAHDALVELAQTAVVQRGGALARVTVQAAERCRGRAETIRELVRLIASDAFLSLGPAVRRSFVETFGTLTSDTKHRQLLFRLQAEAGFAGLPWPEQVAILDHVRGPILSADAAQMRRNRLKLVWDARRAELALFLDTERFRRAGVEGRAELLRDFLHQRGRTVYFLNATSLNGHAALVFGDPRDRRSLSYGRRWTVTKAQTPVARVYCPDPTIQSGWTKPAQDAATRYAFKKIAISRYQERFLIEWIEKSYAIADDLRVKKSALGERRVSASAPSFYETALAALGSLQNAKCLKVTDGYMLAGRPVRGRGTARRTAPVSQGARGRAS